MKLKGERVPTKYNLTRTANLHISLEIFYNNQIWLDSHNTVNITEPLRVVGLVQAVILQNKEGYLSVQ